MALNIKDESVHEVVKQIARITGESQAQAVATAVNERLAKLQKNELADRLLAIGRRTADRMSPEGKRLDHERKKATLDTFYVPQRLDHAALLYDDRGLPT